MFGYVNIYKNELKFKDYNLFRAYYCGLCKSLGKQYNQLVRLGLSYDMTFLAILADSLNDDIPQIENDGCIKHIGKHMICKKNRYIDFCSDASVILYYYKLTDDINDNKSVKAFLARLAYNRAIKKACSKHNELSVIIRDNLNKLSGIEKQNCTSIDLAAHPFAEITKAIFACASSEIANLGYNIGRYIYIVDALADIQNDIKSNSYNPFISLYGYEFVKSKEFIKRAQGTVNMTLAAVSEEYSQLTIKKNKSILDNIIYMGLRFCAESLFKKMEEENERSLRNTWHHSRCHR